MKLFLLLLYNKHIKMPQLKQLQKSKIYATKLSTQKKKNKTKVIDLFGIRITQNKFAYKY